MSFSSQRLDRLQFRLYAEILVKLRQQQPICARSDILENPQAIWAWRRRALLAWATKWWLRYYIESNLRSLQAAAAEEALATGDRLLSELMQGISVSSEIKWLWSWRFRFAFFFSVAGMLALLLRIATVQEFAILPILLFPQPDTLKLVSQNLWAIVILIVKSSVFLPMVFTMGVALLALPHEYSQSVLRDPEGFLASPSLNEYIGRIQRMEAKEPFGYRSTIPISPLQASEDLNAELANAPDPSLQLRPEPLFFQCLAWTCVPPFALCLLLTILSATLQGVSQQAVKIFCVMTIIFLAFIIVCTRISQIFRHRLTRSERVRAAGRPAHTMYRWLASRAVEWQRKL